MAKWGLSEELKFGLTFENHKGNPLYQQNKGEKTHDHLNICINSFGQNLMPIHNKKSQHPFIIKTLRKPAIEANSFSLIKGNMKKPSSYKTNGSKKKSQEKSENTYRQMKMNTQHIKTNGMQQKQF